MRCTRSWWAPGLGRVRAMIRPTGRSGQHLAPPRTVRGRRMRRSAGPGNCSSTRSATSGITANSKPASILGRQAGGPVDQAASGPIISRRCTCSSRSRTFSGPRDVRGRPGSGHLRAGTAAGGTRADHPHALITANGLGADLRALGDFQASLASDRESSKGSRNEFGADYPRTLAAAHNLGCSLRLVGDSITARGWRGDARPAAAGTGRDHPRRCSRWPAWPSICGLAGAFGDR